MYLTTLHTIFQNGKKEFNDEERNIIQIPNSPFSAYSIPKNNPTTKKALDVEQIRSIIEFKTNEMAPMIARDVFVMSFFMIGMNSIDMYYFEQSDGGRFGYEHRKTKGCREDRAFISIKHEPELLPYIERYKDPLGDRAFLNGEYKEINRDSCDDAKISTTIFLKYRNMFNLIVKMKLCIS